MPATSTIDTADLTPAQTALFIAIVGGKTTHDGHTRKPMEALAERGLITFRFESPRYTGRGKSMYTARLTQETQRRLAAAPGLEAQA